jgi:hypothetical protein
MGGFSLVGEGDSMEGKEDIFTAKTVRNAKKEN